MAVGRVIYNAALPLVNCLRYVVATVLSCRLVPSQSGDSRSCRKGLNVETPDITGVEMADSDVPRTRLEQVLRQRHCTIDQFREDFAVASGMTLSPRQAYRWVAGEIARLPYPRARGTLELMFGEPVGRLLGPPYGVGAALTPRGPDQVISPGRGNARADWEGQLISMSADRARNFLARAEETNLGPGTIDQLTDDVRRLAIASQERPFPLLLSDLVETQDRAFGLLEGRQKPEQTRDLYLLAGIVSGFLAKASHDVGASHDALTQARAAYACADNAGHDGLRAWIRGLQTLITYWDGRFDDSVRYAQLGAPAAQRSRGTAAVWLLSSEARSLAALSRMTEARASLNTASEARDHVQADELDQLGSICTFSRATQLYYAADSLAWGTATDAAEAERTAAEAIDALSAAPVAERGGYGNEQGALCDLAVARLLRGELDGATQAVAPVLELPRERRQQGIVRSVERVRTTLAALDSGAREVLQLGDAIDSFLSERLALPQ